MTTTSMKIEGHSCLSRPPSMLQSLRLIVISQIEVKSMHVLIATAVLVHSPAVLC